MFLTFRVARGDDDDDKRQKNSEPQNWGPQCDSHQLGRGP